MENVFSQLKDLTGQINTSEPLWHLLPKAKLFFSN